jgi:hypothetical protein
MTWVHIKLLWKLDEIIVGFRIQLDAEIGKVIGTGLAAFLSLTLSGHFTSPCAGYP